MMKPMMMMKMMPSMTMNKGKLNLKFLSILFLSLFASMSKADKINGPNLPSQFRSLMKDSQPTFIIANAGIPYSFDPLEELNSRNSRIIKMIHSKIIEYDANGRFYSNVIKSYNYHEAKKILILEIKKGVKYTDGSLLTAEDVALSIKRNAFLRPGIPGISEIIGLSKWLKNEHPLLNELAGISVDKDKVFVKFASHVASPIDKFVWCFGVIPSHSIEMKTGKLKLGDMAIPPSVGEYKIVESKIANGTHINEKTFIKLEKVNKHDSSKPDIVWLAYMSPANIGNYLSDFHNKVVICANEIDIEPYKLKDFKRIFNVHTTPRIMHSYLILNPKSKVFSDRRVRQYFAKKYRDTMSVAGYSVEGSQLTNEMFGYLSLSDLENYVEPFSKQEEQKILDHLRKNPPVWMQSPTLVTEPFAEIFNTTCNSLMIPLKRREISKFEGQYQEMWNRGELSIRQGYGSLGPADPTGDLKTTFSGIHSFLSFVTEDPKLQNLLANLEYFDRDSHVELNKYLFVESKFSVVSNYSRIYLFTGKAQIKNNLKMQEPVPWEFFQQ